MCGGRVTKEVIVRLEPAAVDALEAVEASERENNCLLANPESGETDRTTKGSTGPFSACPLA